MSADIRKGLQTGFSFGAIILFLTLIGFTVVGSTLIAGISGADAATTISLLVFLGLVAIWCGASALSREDKLNPLTVPQVLVRGLTAGLVAGFLVGVFIYMIGVQWLKDVDLRQYLVQMSPEAIAYLTMGRVPIFAFLNYLGFFALASLAGALLRWLYSLIRHMASQSASFGQMLRSAGFSYAVIGLLIVVFQLAVLRFDQTIWAYILDVIAVYVIFGLRRGQAKPPASGTPVSQMIPGLIVGLIYGIVVTGLTLIRFTPNEAIATGSIPLPAVIIGVNLIGAALWHLIEAAGTTLPQQTVLRSLIYSFLVVYVLTFPLRLDRFGLFTFGTVAIYVLLGLGLNIVVGLAGLLDLGYVVFFAIGAYTVGLLTAPEPHNLNWSFWATIPFGIIIAALIGVLLGVPVLRLRGDYLAIVTLGFGEIIRVMSKSDMLTSFARGPKGLPGIAMPQIGGEPINQLEFVYLILIGVLIVIFVTTRLQNSRIGRAWIAMREDETVAQAMGINTLRYKLLAFGIGAALAGLGGLLFASRNQFTGPEDHTLLVSINVLAVVIVGGMGSIPGVILGAFVLKGLPEILRQLEDYRILAFGALLVVMMILRPEGLWPSERRRMEIHEKEIEPPDMTVDGEAHS
jgi:ABC-type branched-subunit amino acid transport system permease subunit